MTLIEAIADALAAAPEGWTRTFEVSEFDVVKGIKLTMTDRGEGKTLADRIVVPATQLRYSIYPDDMMTIMVNSMRKDMDNAHRMYKETGQEVH